VDFHVFTKAVGKFVESTAILPSDLVFAKAKITIEVFGLMSSVEDCPQNYPPNPQ
jgi:hypothetical protein